MTEHVLQQLAALLATEIAPAVADELERRGHLNGGEPGEPWHLLSVEEAATRLGRSTRWVRDHKDEIGWVRLDGGALAFDLEDLRRFALERRLACTPPGKCAQEQGRLRSSLRARQKA